MRRTLLWLNMFLLLLGLAALARPAVAAPPADFQTTQVIGSGLDGPSAFEIAPDGRIFVLERAGQIKVYKNGQLLPTPFAELPSTATGDRGLIGIAFDPDFSANHWVYFYYTGTDLLNRVVRFDASGDVGTDGPLVLYETKSPSELLHVGGTIGFGPDGKMYLAVGDNGYPPNAQDLSNPHGKILRINKDGSVPSDNPLVGQPGKLPEIWAYGFRNPWRFQFDAVSGRLYGGDVGDYTWEEVNLITRGDNYGWPACEGVCDDPSMTNPIHAYPHNGESASVTGGPVYRGSLFPPEYRGSLFFGDYAKGFIKRLSLNEAGQATGVADFDLNAGSVVDMKVAPDGSMYYLTYYPGRLYRITYATGNQVPTANASANVTKGVEPLEVKFSSSGSFDPDGTPLSYRWEFGDGSTSAEANPTKTYTAKGSYTVQLTVSDGTNEAQATPLVIQVGTPPSLTIGSPADGSLYRAGDAINYTASATDGAGFDLNDAAISTDVIFHHQTHLHPFIDDLIGRTGSFTVPNSGEASAEVWYEIKVTASDTNGLSTTKSVNLYPRKAKLSLDTSPPGLQMMLDGVPVTAPVSLDSVVGFQRELSVPMVQEAGGQVYGFERWSDGGAALHTVTIGDSGTVAVAHFAATAPFSAEYFSNQTLSGAPVLERLDNQVNFNWGTGSPDPAVPADHFSARWRKTQFFPAGRYRLSAATDDGVRLWLDGQPVIDRWRDQMVTATDAVVELAAGDHVIVMEYYENGGDAVAELEWEPTTAALTPPPSPPPADGYSAQYFDNQTLSGEPKLTRTDPAINFNWGSGSPDPAIPADRFSARWTKEQEFAAGDYEFTVTADDGVRLYLDGALVIDKWLDQPPATYRASRRLSAGSHQIKLEYYENGGGAVAEFGFGPAPAPAGFRGEYFDNQTLSGAPKLTRTDPAINFNWGTGSPDPALPADRFSVRWTKSQTFAAGSYTFSLWSDDGVRFWIDDQLLVDDWTDHPSRNYTPTVSLSEGTHTLRLEYYENGGDAAAVLEQR
ncbi:PQQ-dependent sugar dehydrogenase [Candidatus Parcubacteria bacterium]|nr:PQQ-dependent sugar dehydrogenase [Candidatus Parcubacteria bacterium]